MSKVFTVPLSPCPKCGQPINSATCTIVPGMIGVCVGCCNPLIFDDQLQTHLLHEHQIAALPAGKILQLRSQQLRVRMFQAAMRHALFNPTTGAMEVMYGHRN